MLTLTSIGKCKISIKSISVTTITKQGMQTHTYTSSTALVCGNMEPLAEQYNNYYGVMEPYIIEYPFS
jgi:hypothetical protein